MNGHCSVIKLKPNSTHLVNKWKDTITQHMADAIQTLNNEGVSVESWFITTIDGSDYLITYTLCNDIEAAHIIAKDSTCPIDIMHKAFKKAAWAEHVQVTALLHIHSSK
jgi:hypothetical protein